MVLAWAVLCFNAFVLGFAIGVAIGRHQAATRPPRLRYYGHRLLTGSEARQRLFGGPHA